MDKLVLIDEGDEGWLVAHEGKLYPFTKKADLAFVRARFEAGENYFFEWLPEDIATFYDVTLRGS